MPKRKTKDLSHLSCDLLGELKKDEAMAVKDWKKYKAPGFSADEARHLVAVTKAMKKKGC